MIPPDNFLCTLAVNVDNKKLTDAEFRQIFRNTLPSVNYSHHPDVLQHRCDQLAQHDEHVGCLSPEEKGELESIRRRLQKQRDAAIEEVVNVDEVDSVLNEMKDEVKEKLKNIHPDDRLREVELKVFVHTTFESDETLEETGKRIADEITEDLKNTEWSAGIELIKTTALNYQDCTL